MHKRDVPDEKTLTLENYKELYHSSGFLGKRREFLRKHADLLPLEFAIRQGGVRFLTQLPQGYRQVKLDIRPHFETQEAVIDSECSLEYQLGAMSTWDGDHINAGENIIGECTIRLISDRWQFADSSLCELGVNYTLSTCPELAIQRDQWLAYVVKQYPKHVLSGTDEGRDFVRFDPIDKTEWGATNVVFRTDGKQVGLAGDGKFRLGCDYDSEIHLVLLLVSKRG